MFLQNETGRRCHDLPTSHRNMDFNRLVLLVIPGPKAPKSWDAYLKRTLEKVAEMQTDAGALMLEQPVEKQRPDGSKFTEMVVQPHKVYLGAFFADLPGRSKAMCRGCTAAWIPCSWCLLQVMKLYISPSYTYILLLLLHILTSW